jgi:hypothetical protein
LRSWITFGSLIELKPKPEDAALYETKKIKIIPVKMKILVNDAMIIFSSPKVRIFIHKKAFCPQDSTKTKYHEQKARLNFVFTASQG